MPSAERIASRAEDPSASRSADLAQVRDVLASQTIALSPFKVRRIEISGGLGPGVTAKDVILTIIGRLGVQAGDRVGLYLPMIPELAIAMLACARIGAIHSVVFGGFSAEALRDRLNDAQVKVVVTADGGYRRGAIVPLKASVDDALHPPSV